MRSPVLLGVIAVTVSGRLPREQATCARAAGGGLEPARDQGHPPGQDALHLRHRAGHVRDHVRAEQGPRGPTRVGARGGPAIQPDQRRDVELVYVADLRTLQKDGTYPTWSCHGARSSRGGEPGPRRRHRPAPKTPVRPPAARSSSTPPAGARPALGALVHAGQGIPFVEKDIEKIRRPPPSSWRRPKRGRLCLRRAVLEVTGP